jgi:hypothetical protein
VANELQSRQEVAFKDTPIVESVESKDGDVLDFGDLNFCPPEPAAFCERMVEIVDAEAVTRMTMEPEMSTYRGTLKGGEDGGKKSVVATVVLIGNDFCEKYCGALVGTKGDKICLKPASGLEGGTPLPLM